MREINEKMQTKQIQMRQKIKFLQKKLDYAVKNNHDYDSELLELSQELDKLIVDYYYLDSNNDNKNLAKSP